jgi:hypothetical protein
MQHLHTWTAHLPPTDIQILILLSLLALIPFLPRPSFLRTAVRTTSLPGPRNTSLLFGLYRHINESPDPGLVYERWAEKYGPAYVVPGGFGSKRVVICDPRANAHFYARETFGYVQTKLSRVFIENLVGGFIHEVSRIGAYSMGFAASLDEDCCGLKGRVISGGFSFILLLALFT